MGQACIGSQPISFLWEVRTCRRFIGSYTIIRRVIVSHVLSGSRHYIPATGRGNSRLSLDKASPFYLTFVPKNSISYYNMDIAVVGIGYVGLVSATCFAELGANVRCIDTDRNKIEQLNSGTIPIYEPGLEKMIARNVKAGRLRFGTEIEQAVPEADIVFIAVGTPAGEDGSADMSYVLDAARSIGRAMSRYILIVTKSTVPVGSYRLIRKVIQEELDKREVLIDFDIASNPEFLKEGNAIDDFMKPDRVVVGVDSDRARELITSLYKPMLLNNFRVLFMDIASAEMTKYAANAMLATRISFMNDVANLCERVGADVSMVRLGIGSDSRIGSKFLYPGCGYGGSCFPKDVKALIRTAEDNGYRMEVLEAVERVNEKQKSILFDKFSTYYKGNVQGRCVAIWGLSFKPGTDDMREAPSLVLIEKLLEVGCRVRVYDPVAMKEAQKRLGDKVEYTTDMYDAVRGAEALFHVTEWKEFRMPDWSALSQAMAASLVIDGRNVYELPADSDFTLLNIGNSAIESASSK